MACHTLNTLARQALDTIAAWDEEQTQRNTEAQAVRYDIEHTPSATRERQQRHNDVVCTRVVAPTRVSYDSILRSLAGTLISEHERDVRRKRRIGPNTDAAAAWKLVLRTSNPQELRNRVRTAAQATFRVPN